MTHRRLGIGVAGFVLFSGLFGCSDREAIDVEGSKTALNTNPKTTDFAIYAHNSARLMDRARVTGGGDVGVRMVGSGPFIGGPVELTMVANAEVDTTRSVIANRLLMRDRARAGDIQVNRVTVINNATFTRRFGFPANLPALPPLAPVAPGTAPLAVNAGATVVASPGAHGAVSVGDRGTLRLGGGVYQIASLQIGNDARLEALGPVQVRIAGRLATYDRVFVGAAPGVTLTAGELRIEVSGKNGASGSLGDWPKAAAFGNDARVKAVLLVPNGALLSGQRARVVGALVGRDVSLDLDSTLTYQSGVGPSDCLPSCNDGNPCTTDTCSVGACVYVASPAGTACGDGNACNGAELCDGAGTCQAGTPVVCEALDQCHVVGTCDPATGVCSDPPQPDGTECEDASACTANDVCTAGVCGGAAYVCDDGLACTADSCNGDGTCSFAVTPGSCLIDGACQAGADGNPANPCEQCAPELNQAAWTPKPAGTTCNDGNACTQTDVCDGASVCAGTAYACADGLECTADACNGDGTCTFAILAGNCAIDGACYAAGTTNPANPCQTCAPALSATSWSAKPLGTVCDDHNPCTSGDTCTAGACGGTAYSCDDGLACTADSCNGDGSCNHAIEAGSCAIGGACHADGASNPANACQVCNAANATSWTNQADGTTCTDPACSSIDGGAGSADGGSCPTLVCIAGTCTGNCVPGQLECAGLTVRVCDATGNWQDQSSCDDGNPCTGDACAAGACTHTLTDPGTACGTGNPCAGFEACDGTGQCLCQCSADMILCQGACYPSCTGGKIFDPADCTCKCPETPTINPIKIHAYYRSAWGYHRCDYARFNVDINGVPIGEVNLNNASDGGDRDSTLVASAEQVAAAAVTRPIRVNFVCALPSCHGNVGQVEIRDLVTGAVMFTGFQNDAELELGTCF